MRTKIFKHHIKKYDYVIFNKVLLSIYLSVYHKTKYSNARKINILVVYEWKKLEGYIITEYNS